MKPIFAQLPHKDLPNVEVDRIKRIILFDPTDVYSRSEIDPFKRHQSKISLHLMFPAIHSPNRKCDCGCGQRLEGRQKRWATSECSAFVNRVYIVLYGTTKNIGFYLRCYYGDKCAHCSCTDKDLFVDHIIPVKHGGGGSWLNNFQLLCHTCHVQKTKDDFGWKGAKKKVDQPADWAEAAALKLF